MLTQTKFHTDLVWDHLPNSETLAMSFSVLAFTNRLTRINLMVKIMELTTEYKSFDPLWAVNPSEVDYCDLAIRYMEYKQPWKQ
jgi:hypothetical protein